MDVSERLKCIRVKPYALKGQVLKNEIFLKDKNFVYQGRKVNDRVVQRILPLSVISSFTIKYLLLKIDSGLR